MPFNSQKKNRDGQSVEPVGSGSNSGQPEQQRRRSVHAERSPERDESPFYDDEDDGPEETPLVLASSAMGHIGSLSAVSVNRPHDFTIVQRFPPNEIGRAALR